MDKINELREIIQEAFHSLGCMIGDSDELIERMRDEGYTMLDYYEAENGKAFETLRRLEDFLNKERLI